MRRLIPYLLIAAMMVWGFNLMMRGHRAVKQSYTYAKDAQYKLNSIAGR